MTIYTISEVELEQSDGDFDKSETSSVQTKKAAREALAIRTNRPPPPDGRSRAGRTLLQRTRVEGTLPRGLGFPTVSCRVALADNARTTSEPVSSLSPGEISGLEARQKTRAHFGILIPNAGMRRGLCCGRKTGGIQQYGQRCAARQILSRQHERRTFRRMKIA
jgi:hypothetical protein